MRIILLIGSLFLIHLSVAQAEIICPLGPKDTKLKIHRVMLNFDQYTRQADSTVTKGIQLATDVSDADLDQAFADLQVVQVCIEAELSSQDLDMFPDQAKNLTGQAQADFIHSFLQAMGQLKILAQEYAQEFKTLRSVATTDRNFTSAKAIKKAFNDFIDEAHSHF